MKTEMLLKDRALELGIVLEEKQLTQFRDYYEILIEWNGKVNLTAITKPEEVVEKHFIDSMMLFHTLDVQQGSRLIDIGTGAGFPAVPIKIVRNDLTVTLVDALQKRISFLNALSAQLGLDMSMNHGRAEELIKQQNMRENFDIAVSRAVAKLGMLAEYVLPYVAVGGKFVAWKGPSGEEEVQDADKAISVLGAKVADIKKYELATGEKRLLIIMEKVRQTPGIYPRKHTAMKTKPL